LLCELLGDEEKARAESRGPSPDGSKVVCAWKLELGTELAWGEVLFRLFLPGRSWPFVGGVDRQPTS